MMINSCMGCDAMIEAVLDGAGMQSAVREQVGAGRTPAGNNLQMLVCWSWTSHGRRVPHISLVFREMWDSTKVGFQPWHSEPLPVKSRGIPRSRRRSGNCSAPREETPYRA